MQAATYKKSHLKVADELFITLALLHREQPDKSAFKITEVLDRARQEGLGDDRPEQRSLRLHAYQHAAANLPPGQGGKYRMIFRERDNRVRLLKDADYVHPERHQKNSPAYEEIPERYHELLDWAKLRRERDGEDASNHWLEGLHRLKGMGKEIWGRNRS